MRVAMLTSVSSNIADIASLTLPNKIEYCLKHDYSLIIDNMPYDKACESSHEMVNLLNNYDMIWAIDADTLITNMNIKIEELSCLGPHMTVCEEGMVNWNKINCGSIVWKNTAQSKWLLESISRFKDAWKPMACGSQTWLMSIQPSLGDIITIAPLRSFNSCVWNKPGGGEGEPGSNWSRGDFVYHVCGVFPKSEKVNYLTATIPLIER